MSRLALLVWLADLVLDTAGHLFLKAATRRANRMARRAFWRAMLGQPMLWLAMAAFVAEFMAWLSFMTLVPLSQAVLVGCINILGVMIGGRVVFGERVTPARGAAIAMIGIGVTLVGWGGA